MTEWIKANDRTPKNEDEILFISDNIVIRGFFKNYRYFCFCGCEWCDVKQWMPLPKGPIRINLGEDDSK